MLPTSRRDFLSLAWQVLMHGARADDQPAPALSDELKQSLDIILSNMPLMLDGLETRAQHIRSRLRKEEQLTPLDTDRLIDGYLSLYRGLVFLNRPDIGCALNEQVALAIHAREIHNRFILEKFEEFHQSLQKHFREIEGPVDSVIKARKELRAPPIDYLGTEDFQLRNKLVYFAGVIGQLHPKNLTYFLANDSIAGFLEKTELFDTLTALREASGLNRDAMDIETTYQTMRAHLQTADRQLANATVLSGASRDAVIAIAQSVRPLDGMPASKLFNEYSHPHPMIALVGKNGFIPPDQLGDVLLDALDAYKPNGVNKEYAQTVIEQAKKSLRISLDRKASDIAEVLHLESAQRQIPAQPKAGVTILNAAAEAVGGAAAQVLSGGAAALIEGAAQKALPPVKPRALLERALASGSGIPPKNNDPKNR